MLLKEGRKWYEQSTKLAIKVHYKIYCNQSSYDYDRNYDKSMCRKNRLEPTLILQSVNDVTNCKRNKTEKHFFSVFIKYTQLTLIQPRLNPGIKKKFMGSGIKFCNNFGIRDQNFRLKCGISRQKIYLVTTLVNGF